MLWTWAITLSALTSSFTGLILDKLALCESSELLHKYHGLPQLESLKIEATDIHNGRWTDNRWQVHMELRSERKIVEKHGVSIPITMQYKRLRQKRKWFVNVGMTITSVRLLVLLPLASATALSGPWEQCNYFQFTRVRSKLNSCIMTFSRWCRMDWFHSMTDGILISEENHY